ncbi:MAG: DUF4249 domain-containing protein [Cytophagaceae bacterium]|nr:DUF4249 domain-containing protein [Cytophagaceae bacterium]
MCFLRIVLCLGCLWMGACVKVPPPEPPPELAVFCILSPGDSLLTVTLSRVVRVGERFRLDSVVTVSNAEVVLAEGIRMVRLTFSPRHRRYEARNADFVKPDAEYRLTVRLPGQPPLLARFTVPSVCPVLATNGGFVGEDYVFSVDWMDIAGQKNYYYLTGVVEGGIPGRPLNGQVTVGTVGVSWGSGANSRLFSTDQGRDGQRQYSPEGLIRKAGRATDPLVMQLVLQNMDKAYFEYGQKGFGRIDTDDGLISRFKEPILVESNVENGLGIFSAYTRQTVRVRIR